MPSDCIFCKIVAGQIPCDKVHETANVLVFKDISPAAPVHYLVIPKKHIPSLLEATQEDAPVLAEILLVAGKLGASVPELDRNFRLAVSTGPDAGQVVMHMHYHLLGGRKLTWPPG